jgi:hypothetical protein
MKMNNAIPGAALLSLLAGSSAGAAGYKNFTVSVYARAYEVREMKDLQWLEERWSAIEKQVHVGKIYLETHRDGVMPDAETIEQAKRFFSSRGIRVAGGITFTQNERDHFKTFCYSDPEMRKKTKEIAEFTARHFDEIILDDFFFTNCKCDACIRAKGKKSWTQFRLEQMDDAARNLVVGPAKAVNPKVKFVIKFPNWYDHFQYLGFDLENEPRIFDGIYTGTETRDPVFSDQHLQPYESYEIFRYFENIKPGGNGGGWVDPFARGTLDRYGEQLQLTLFAKAPEITLFDFRSLLEPVRREDGTEEPDTLVGRVAGYVFGTVDGFVGKLGNPVGIKSYKPYQSSGEDFLHNYMGMLGIPIEMTAVFPAEEKTIFLTQSASFDPAIVGKIKGQLQAGKNVVITSGLLKALQGKGIEDIAEIESTDRKSMASDFWQPWHASVWHSDAPILVPEIRYPTNDVWDLVSTLTSGTSYPILLDAGYSKGHLYVLTIPDNFGDLYHLPIPVLNRIKEVMMRDLPVRVEGPAQVALFLYDNDSFIVESFQPQGSEVKIVADPRFAKLRDLRTGQVLEGQPYHGRIAFDTFVPPHSYRVLTAARAQ